MNDKACFDDELTRKLNSGLYSFARIIKDTGISRYNLNIIKDSKRAPAYIIVALNDYFKKAGE